MKIFCLNNLASKEITAHDLDSAPVNECPRFANKEAYRAWCITKAADHVFINVVGGIMPNVRVSTANPAQRRFAIIIEYDSQVPPAWPERLRSAVIPPTWACLTYSGNSRSYYELEYPILCDNRELDRAFLTIAHKELKVSMLQGGFQPEETIDPSHYFEIGHDWVKIGQPLPAALVEGWLIRALDTLKLNKLGIAIPVEAVRLEGERRFPGRWPGGWADFQFGSRGCRFWDDSADAFAVLAYPEGCVAFSGDIGFRTWGAIFGHDWERRVTDSKLGEAVKGMYYDNGAKAFWSNGSNSGWQLFGTDPIVRRLRGSLNAARPPGGVGLSEVERALTYIEQRQSVDGAFPAFFRPGEIVQINQRHYLNTSRLRLLEPDPEPGAWGQGFPWLASFLDKLFREAKVYYLTWLAHYYQSCFAGNPVRGLALFIAGPPNSGKTFLNDFLHHRIFGACGVATDYLLGNDQFNDQLVACPVWTTDDAVANSDERSRNHFRQSVKSLVANDEIVMRAMYRSGIRVPCNNRFVCTMNDDVESLGLLPSSEMSMMDKCILVRAFMTFRQFPSDEEIMPELPAFCAYLRDIPKDPAIWIGGRFGVTPYHDPELVAASDESLESTSSHEIIQLWGNYWFDLGEGAKADYWEGSPSDLVGELAGCLQTKEQARTLCPNGVKMGRYLTKLLKRGTPGITRLGLIGSGRKRTYRISRDLIGQPQIETEPF